MPPRINYTRTVFGNELRSDVMRALHRNFSLGWQPLECRLEAFEPGYFNRDSASFACLRFGSIVAAVWYS